MQVAARRESTGSFSGRWNLAHNAIIAPTGLRPPVILIGIYACEVLVDGFTKQFSQWNTQQSEMKMAAYTKKINISTKGTKDQKNDENTWKKL